MLSEARARLANTKGKKAKRKAREKQLEEARRLAGLQKRRELKAAGIDVAKPKKKLKGIDYIKEIPFQKRPAAGFYEVDFSDQDRLKNEPFQAVPLEQIDQKRRREEQLDQQKQELAKKQKKKEETNLPLAIMQLNKLNDPEATKYRTKLLLPTPQLSDQDLSEFSKSNTEIEEYASTSRITQSLLPSTGATPLPSRTPMRTPLPSRTPAKEDHIMKEVQNLIALTAQQTPLIGGENPSLHPSDFTGVTPKLQDIKTPNVYATPARMGPPTTSNRKELATPLRDNLGLNSDDTVTVKTKKKGLDIKNALRTLPTPQENYKFAVPELPSSSAVDEDQLEEDSSDVLKLQLHVEKEKLAIKHRLRSKVLQRGLPRPLALPSSFVNPPKSKNSGFLQEAEDLIRLEMIQLITYEAIEYPIKNCKITSSKPPVQDEFSEQLMKDAESLLLDEVKALKLSNALPEFTEEDFEKVSKEMEEELTYIPSQDKYVRTANLKSKEKVESMSKQFEAIKGIMSKEAAKAKKLETKLNVYYGGYSTRANQLIQQLKDLHVQYDQAVVEKNSFARLREHEIKGAAQRLEKLKEEVRVQEEREAENQKRFYNLLTEKDSLLAKLKTVQIQ
jgi:pre-mRNA-splicing factor CDC5/CEF1